MNIHEQALRDNAYPGRGIVAGVSADGRSLVQVYWIMGRSENSRNRVFVSVGDSVKTEAHDPSKMTDPSLIIYHPVRVYGNAHIVTNGDQIDTIFDYLTSGGTAEQALLTRCFEPDPPNFTPRISCVTSADSGTVMLSILRTVGNDETVEKKEFYTFTSIPAGEGRCIHTYNGDANPPGSSNPLPSFDRLPYPVELLNNAHDNAHKFWDLLNADNRVSLLAKHIDIAGGAVTVDIINRW